MTAFEQGGGARKRENRVVGEFGDVEAELTGSDSHRQQGNGFVLVR